MTAPVNTVVPAITGTVAVDGALTLSDGTWTNSPTSFAYAWLADGVAIAGATTNAYIVARSLIDAIISGRVTATNASGSTAAVSVGQAVPETLIVETGAVVPGAESYATAAFTTAYHSKRGNTAWAALSAANKETMLRRATDYMIQAYRTRWSGYRLDGTQALDWPRTFVYLEPFVHGIVGTFPFLVPSDSVPLDIQTACAELALRAAVGTPLLDDLGQGVRSETIGPLTTVYNEFTPQVVRYLAVDNLVKPYLKNGGNFIAVRA